MKLLLHSILAILLLSCVGKDKQDCLKNLQENLSPKFEERNVLGEVINIRDSISCFAWDSLLIESGYGTKESIRKYYNIEIPYDFRHSSSDSEALIFFIKNGSVVHHIAFNTTCKQDQVCKTYDFKTLILYNRKSIIAKKNAVFEIFSKTVKDNQGNQWRSENAIRIKK